MKNKKKIYLSVAIILAVMIIGITGYKIIKNKGGEVAPELLVARNYEQVQDGDEAVDGTDYVQFDAYYLRDLDGDGYAEKLRGTCKEIGTQDTLYMDLNVLTNGTLKDATITINGKNFYFATTLVKDSVISQDYISENTKEIKLNDVKNGTEKLMSGIVQSGDYTNDSTKASAIGNDTNKYTVTDNTITLTGIHVAADGTETPISKTVKLTNDWYGTTKTQVYLPDWLKKQEYTMESALDEENEKINIKFKVRVRELDYELILANQHLEIEIPDLIGYKATAVSVDNSNAVVNYDSESGKATIDLNSNINSNGKVTNTISRNLTYEVTITYPFDAYKKAEDTGFILNIPVDATYSGYNNTNSEYTNPYVSNIAEGNISVLYGVPSGDVARVDVVVGDYENRDGIVRHVISKGLPTSIYNNVEIDENSKDKYEATWILYTGVKAAGYKAIIKEDPNNYTDKFMDVNGNYYDMIDYVSNVGIYFSDPSTILADDGYIKVYNDETNELLHTFTKNDWNNYSKSYPYPYNKSIKHIRIETSELTGASVLKVHNVKQIDDTLLTAQIDKSVFDSFSEIYSYSQAYLVDKDENQGELNSSHANAIYEEPHSEARITLDSKYISNQETKKNANIIISTIADDYNTNSWKNGEFLIKYPKEIIDININEVKCSNSSVTIIGFDTYKEGENFYTKIYTSNDTEEQFDLIIDADITADPRETTVTRDLELYYYNQACNNYYDDSKVEDSYDINGNGNVDEYIGKNTVKINLIAPSNLLTSQTLTNYDDNESVTVAPQEAEINKSDETRTATINVNLTNNYSGTISEVKVLGKIPFKGNTYQLNGSDLGSQFDTTMISGIVIPDELKDYATVYYSYNESVTEDIDVAENGWTTIPEDMSKVKSYLIDLGDYVMPVEDITTFSYDIQIPSGIDYNQVAYSDHAVYYCLDTDQGKLKTQTEPNKLGIRIAEKFDLEITKYETNTNKVVSGVVFSAQEAESEESKTATTESGVATIKNLYVEREYTVKEIKTNDNYILNDEEIKLIGHVVNGELQIEILSGSFKDDVTVETQDNANTKVKASLENEVKYNFVLNKTQAGTDEAIQGIRFKLTDYNGKIKYYTTNTEGKLTIKLLEPNKQYTLEEVYSKGHYLKDAVSFMMVRDANNNLEFKVLSGDLDTLPTIDTTGDVPVVTAGLANEKIPTYSLKITKKETDTETTIAGAQFKLTGENKEDNVLYTTDENGQVTISNLYQYVEGKDVTGEYTLTEVYPSEGYILNDTPLQFKAQKDATGNLKLEITNGTIRENIDDVVVDTTDENNPVIQITIDNDPVFTLTKVDAETGEPLEGVEFQITDMDGNSVTDANGNAVDKVYTDSNGKIRLSLVEGLYKATETKPLEGYATPETYTGIGIGESKAAEYGVKYSNSIGKSVAYFYDSVAVEGGVVGVANNGYVIKYDSNGKVEWSTQEDYSYYGVTAVEDGVIAVAYNGQVVKYDLYGNLVWKNTEKSYSFQKVATVEDGIIAVAYDGKVVKYDLNGNFVWENTEKSYSYYGVTKVEDGIIAVTYDGKVVKYDLSGNFVWENTEKSYYCYGVTAVEDGVIAVGSSGKVVKYDLSGNFVWENTEKSYSYYGVTKVEDGVIAVGLYGQIAKYDLEGKFIWENTEKSYHYYGVTAVEDGVIALSNTGTVVKYDLNGNIVSENNDNSYNLQAVIGTEDGVIGVDFNGAVVKYDLEGSIVWVNSNYQNIYEYFSAIAVEDGIVVRAHKSQLVKYDFNGNEKWVNAERKYVYSDIAPVKNGFVAVTNGGKIVKFNLDGEEVWVSTDETYYQSATQVEDGIVAVSYSGKVVKYDLDGNVIWENTEKAYRFDKVIVVEDGLIAGASDNGVIAKYDFDGNLVWDIAVGYYYSIFEEDGNVIVLESNGNSLKCDLEGNIIENVEYPASYSVSVTDNNVFILSSDDGTILVYDRYAREPEIEASKSVTVENELIKYKVTTKVNGYGGTISGKDEKPYEEVVYKNDSTKDIIATPIDGYKVQNITVNGETIYFTENTDGTVTLDKFISMTEDKEVIVSFTRRESSFVIKKQDSTNGNPLANARFNIKQVDFREEPSAEKIVGNIVANGKEFSNEDVTLGEKIDGVLGDVTNNGTYYFAEDNGKYVSNNAGIPYYTASSYVKIDLTNYTGTYAVVLNAEISSELNSDIGYATIKTTKSTPSAYNSTDRFMYISGNNTAKDYVKSLKGGKVYYLYLGYKKDGNTDSGNDKLTINSINIYSASVETTNNTYNFVDNGNGGYESNNQGVASTVANSYIPIDLTNYTGKYNLIVNANISSTEYWNFGYATVTTDTTAPSYDDSTEDSYICLVQ